MTATTLESRELLATDRCDSCSAAAQVIVTFLTGELMFCGHHAKEKSAQFQVKAVTIYDPNGFIQP